MSKLSSILSCLGYDFLLSVISTVIGLGLQSDQPSILTAILLWNFTLAFLLPICRNCELLTLIEVVFFGFIIGVIGYSLAVFCGLWLFRKLRRKENLS